MTLIDKEISQTKPFRNNYHKASVNLIYTGKWIIKLHNELFKTFGLSIQQYNILRILNGRYPKTATVKYIRNRMLDKMSDASRVVETLNQKGLIKRSQAIADRRRVDIVILPEGAAILEDIEKLGVEMDNFLSKLNEEEIVLLNNLLDKLRY